MTRLLNGGSNGCVKMGISMNLLKLHPSRHKPKTGDVFAMLLCDQEYLFGRVIATDAIAIPGHAGVLVYIYSARACNIDAPPCLSPDSLLIPPLITNVLPWSKGYFQHVISRELKPEDRLPQHSFRYFNDEIVDEYMRPVGASSGPIGEQGLESFRTIDDAVSAALGMPLAPD